MPEAEKLAEAKPLPPRKRIQVKKILLILFIVFAGIQFIQPDKDNQSMDMRYDIGQILQVPDSIHHLLRTACYDCHSNFTHYTWYSNIQPIGWWMNGHIEDGKEHLNFQEFALIKPNQKWNSTARRQAHKLEEIEETVKGGIMPLRSYVIIHGEAKLTQPQREAICQWTRAARKQLMQ